MEEENFVDLIEEGNALGYRKLNQDEIEYILDGMNAPTAITFMANKVLEDNKRVLRILLSRIEVYPHPQVIEEYREINARKYTESLARPGSNVGSWAAESIMAPLSQMTMNSHRQSGTLNEINSGVDAVREIITATSKIKNPSTLITFKDPLTSFRRAFELRSNIVGITINGLLSSSGTLQGMKETIVSSIDKEHYELYARLYGDIYMYDRLPKYLTRIQLSKYSLYLYKVTTYDIANMISDSSENLICVPSPTFRAFVDVYPCVDKRLSDDKIEEKSSNMLRSMLPIVYHSAVKGVKDIKDLQPERLDIWTNIHKDENSDGSWNIILNKNKMLNQGMKVDNVRELVEFMGLNIEKMEEDRLIITIPSSISEQTEAGNNLNKVYEYFENNNAKYKEKLIEETNQNEACEQSYFIDETEFDKKSVYMYANAAGSNMDGLIYIDAVDIFRTYPNNVSKIYSRFGIEAARTYIINKLYSIIRNGGSSIDIRHIIILADYMTSRGVITKITQPSIQVAGPGPWTAATLATSFKRLSEAAIAGEGELVGNLATSVLTGSVPKLGTGYVSHPDVDKEKKRILDNMKSETHGLTPVEISQLDRVGGKSGIYEYVLENSNNIDNNGDVFGGAYISTDEYIGKIEPRAPIDIGEADPDIDDEGIYYREMDKEPPILSAEKEIGVSTIISSINPIESFDVPSEGFEVVNEEEESVSFDKLKTKEQEEREQEIINNIINNPIDFIPNVVNDMEVPKSLLSTVLVPLKASEEITTVYGKQYILSDTRDVRLIDFSIMDDLFQMIGTINAF